MPVGRVRIVAGLLGLTLLTLGCRSPEPTGEPTQHFTQDARMSIVVEGHKEARFEGEAKIRILRAGGVGDLGLLVVGPDLPVETPSWSIEAFAQLVNFRGDGRYEALPPTPGANATLVNDAYVQLVKGIDGATPEVWRYDRVMQPCEFRIERRGSKGSAVCRGLATADDRFVIRLRMTWEAFGPPVPFSPLTDSTPVQSVTPSP